jgi:hypothetical protein
VFLERFTDPTGRILEAPRLRSGCGLRKERIANEPWRLSELTGRIPRQRQADPVYEQCVRFRLRLRVELQGAVGAGPHSQNRISHVRQISEAITSMVMMITPNAAMTVMGTFIMSHSDVLSVSDAILGSPFLFVGDHRLVRLFYLRVQALLCLVAHVSPGDLRFRPDHFEGFLVFFAFHHDDLRSALVLHRHLADGFPVAVVGDQ